MEKRNRRRRRKRTEFCQLREEEGFTRRRRGEVTAKEMAKDVVKRGRQRKCS